MDYVIQISKDESNLIAACIRQERAAQKVLYEEYFGMMMSVCVRYANNEDDALDLVHEGFIKIFTNLHKYQPDTSLGAWMRRIMVNTCIDNYRKMARRRTESIDQAQQLQSVDADAVSRFSEQEILKAIQKLPVAYRTIFNLYVLEGYSHREIGEQLQITESTSRSNLVKARVKLKNYLVGTNTTINDNDF